MSLVRALATLSLLAILGCDGDDALTTSPDAAVPDGGDPGELAPYPGWPDQVLVRRAGGAFRTSAAQLELDAQGAMWLLRDEWADAEQVFSTPALERYGANGRLEAHVALDPGALAPGFVVHPSGQLSVFLLQPVGEPGLYRLEIARVSRDGEIVGRVAFDDAPGPGEDVYYDESGAHPLPEGPLRFGMRSHVVGMADGEGLYLLAWTYGAKLYRLDAAGAVRWGVQVMPANVGMAFYFIDEVLALDEAGRPHVAYQLFDEDVRIYNQHFTDRPPLAAVGSYDVLVERFDPDGAFQAAQLYGGPGVDTPTGMTVRGGEVLVTGAARIRKHDSPNRTMEWDLFVARGALDDGERRSYHALDLLRDDFAWSLAEAPDGTLYLGGRTDYVQVDTNSEVEDGKGLVLALSPDLERRASLVLTGPRDVQVQALRLGPDGRLRFAGLRDGPLTHTDPAMRNNEGVLGVVDRPLIP